MAGSLPNTHVQKDYAFYLRPDGATAAAAVVYLPAFNAAVRARWAKKGLRLLSEVQGDFSEKGEEALRIGAPTMETCAAVVEEVTRRNAEEVNRIKAEAVECKKQMNDPTLDNDERKLLRMRIGQLERRAESLPKELVDAKRLRAFFLNEQRMRLQLAVPANLRAAVERMRQEQDMTAQIDALSGVTDAVPA